MGKDFHSTPAYPLLAAIGQKRTLLKYVESRASTVKRPRSQHRQGGSRLPKAAARVVLNRGIANASRPFVK